MLRLNVFADAAMMIPDFSSGDVDVNKKRSAILEQLAKAKDSAQELQSDEKQSRIQDALKERDNQHNAAALDSSKSHASQSSEGSHHTANESFRNSTATTDISVSTSELSDAKQRQAEEAAGEQSRKPERLPQLPAAGQNVITGQLRLLALAVVGSVSSQRQDTCIVKSCKLNCTIVRCCHQHC